MNDDTNEHQKTTTSVEVTLLVGLHGPAKAVKLYAQ